jgi:hypothetical protein
MPFGNNFDCRVVFCLICLHFDVSEHTNAKDFELDNYFFSDKCQYAHICTQS